jgi:hypothetical protein
MCTQWSQSLPSQPDEAQQQVGDACKLRTEYLDMKAKSLHRLQELLDEVKWIDGKISEVDIHIGRLYHVIKSSMAGMPAIFARRERTIVIDGGTYHHCCYYIPISKSCALLAVHSVRLDSEWDGEEDGYLSVTLD